MLIDEKYQEYGQERLNQIKFDIETYINPFDVFMLGRFERMQSADYKYCYIPFSKEITQELINTTLYV